MNQIEILQLIAECLDDPKWPRGLTLNGGMDPVWLDYLPPEIGKLTNLEILNVDFNNLTTLPPEIGNLTNLTNLDMSNNYLTELPPEIGNLTNLTDLELGINPLTALPPSYLTCKCQEQP